MKTLKNLSASLAAIGLLVGANSVHAAISAGDSLSVSGTIATQDQVSGNIGYVQYGSDSAIHCYAGAFALTVNDTTSGTTYTIGSFCTDVSVTWKNSDTYTAQTLSSATGVSPKWSQSPQSIENASWIYNTFYVGQSTTAAQDAGIQLAIWMVLYDTIANGTVSYSYSGGVLSGTGYGSDNFKAWGYSSTAMSDAVSYLSALNTAIANHTYTTNSDLWLKPTDGKSQGLIYCPPASTNNVAPVPEPTTVISGVLLALPLGVSAFRIFRKKKDAENLD